MIEVAKSIALLALMLEPPVAPPTAEAVPVPSMFMGEISAGPGTLFVSFQVESGETAGPSKVLVTMPTVGAIAQPARDVVLDGDRLAFSVSSLGVVGRFDGAVKDARYAGTLVLSVPEQPDVSAEFSLSQSVLASQVEGFAAYRGRVQTGGGGLEMTVVLAKESPFGPVASVDIPAQGVDGWPLVVEGLEDGLWRLRLPIGMAAPSFELAEVEDASRLEGVLKQAGMVLPLAMTRLGTYDRSVFRRPQHPAPPFAYEVREVEFRHPHGHRLAGTLTLPSGATAESPVPGAVLVSGSGPQDRDETIFGHKPFLVLADALTQGGIAVLRYDDRGVGGSGGDFASATTFEFATDADAATEFLKSVPEVDAAKVGLIGHSEGGLVAPIVAKWQREQGDPATMLAFAVLLAGPGVPGDQILRVQMRELLEASGIGEDDVAAVLESQGRLLDAAKANDAGAMLDAARDLAAAQASIGAEGQLENALLEAGAEAIVAQMQAPWMKTFLALDPRPLLVEMRIPTLALIGSLDRQVDPDQNLPVIEAALRLGGAPFRARRVDGVNHLFQPAKTGGIDEYGSIETTFDPATLAEIVAWVRDTMGVGDVVETAAPAAESAP
jgi:pimeloyl-ACP methyl ester carboxylesterase